MPRRTRGRGPLQLVRQFNDGDIDDRTFREEMRSLADDERWEAEQAAQQAYDDVMARW